MAQSFRSLILDQVGSTNREALALAEAGEAGPLWIVARRQTAGRGRADRQWLSAPGNLHASLLLNLVCPPTAVPQLALLAGVATLDAIRQADARGRDGGLTGLRLKWPNDILIGQAKCAGILVESSRSPQPQRNSPAPCREGLGVGQTPNLDALESPPCPSPTREEGTLWPAPRHNSVAAVIGIGINLAWHPTGMHRAATHLAAHGYRASAEAVLGSLSQAMQHWLAVWNAGRDFASVRRAWLDRAGQPGEACTVDTGRERIEGTFAGLDSNGALVICDNEGRRHTVTFGDVALVAAVAAAPQEAS